MGSLTHRTKDLRKGDVSKPFAKNRKRIRRDGWTPVNYELLPNWLQDNHYIGNGYRPPLGSMKACCSSIFQLHTETVNIWTHLIGFFVFIFLWLRHMGTLEFATDQLILSCFFLGATVCFGFSATYHTCSCHSQPVAKMCCKLDYIGISALNWGSHIASLYYTFYNNLVLRWIYITAVSVLSVMAIVVSLFDKFGTTQYRTFRAVVFLTSGVSGVIACVHWSFILEPGEFYSWLCLATQFSLYAFGALVYASRIPERFFPGYCNYFCQSHQFFHIIVIIAAYIHLTGIEHLIKLRLHYRLN